MNIAPLKNHVLTHELVNGGKVNDPLYFLEIVLLGSSCKVVIKEAIQEIEDVDPIVLIVVTEVGHLFAKEVNLEFFICVKNLSAIESFLLHEILHDLMLKMLEL